MQNETELLTRSPYEILGLSRWSSGENVKAQYYHLVKESNPEYHEDEFIEVRAAYDVLRDPEKRAANDVANFCAPPPFLFSDYSEFPEHPLSMFKLNQELKTLCGDRDPETLEGEDRAKAAHIVRGMALYQAHHGKLDESKEYLEAAITLDPGNAEAKELRIYFPWKEAFDAALEGRHAEAEQRFAALAEKNVYPGLVYQNLALSQEKQGKKEESSESWSLALSNIKEALDNAEDDTYLKALIVAIHKYTGGKFMDGGMVGGSPKDMGLACVRQGNWKQAVGLLEQAKNEDENDIDVLCQLGWAYLNTNQQTKAFHMWNTALKKSPGRQQIKEHIVKGHSIFGKRLKDQRIFNQALVQYKNALKYEPDNVELRLQLADTYMQMRNFHASLQEFQKIAAKDPRNKDARQGIRESKRLGGIR